MWLYPGLGCCLFLLILQSTLLLPARGCPLIRLQTTLPRVPLKVLGQALIGPAWSYVLLGTNHMGFQRQEVLPDWQGLQDMPLLEG